MCDGKNGEKRAKYTHVLNIFNLFKKYSAVYC